MLSRLRYRTMKTQTAITLAGGHTALAKILGITSSAIHQWGETVPPLRVFELKELRPEWFLKAKQAEAA